MDGFAMPDGSDGNYLHDICLCDRKTGEVFYESMGFIYVELANFVKDEASLENDLDKWLYVLKHMSNMDRLPVYLRKPIFEQLFDIAEYSKLNKEERKMYDVSLKRRWDEYNIRETARERGYEDGLKKGEAEGIEKGMEKGMEKGIEKGIEKGKEESKKEFVRNLILKTHFSDEEIMEMAAVTLDFVKVIRDEVKKENSI